MLTLSALHLKCFGAFSASIQSAESERAPLALRTDKVRGLLVYLALEPRPHPRETLAGMFWPEMSDEAAATNLRTSLHRLRQPIEAMAAIAPDLAQRLLDISRQTVSLIREYVSTDVKQFEDLLHAYKTHAHTNLSACDDCLARLTEAVGLYQDDLLAGFGIGDATAFEEWLTLRREALRHLLLEALRDLAHAYEQRPQPTAGSTAQRFAQRLVSLDPLSEDAQRLLMRLLMRNGQPSAALAQYETCRQVLANELSIEPDAQTTALYEQIRSGNFRFSIDDFGFGSIENSKFKIQNSHDWGDMPAPEVFHGRTAEMQQLQSWLVQEHCRLVSVLGMGGVGKTTLAAAAAQAAAPYFEVVIWRSLLNAPPLDEVLRDWLQALSQHTLNQIPESLDERLRLLLDFLRQRHCLLVLDNVESILQPSEGNHPRAGEVRAGYEGYALLFERLALSEHRSCVLLTSREHPYALNRVGREMKAIQRLALTGLDAQAGAAILQGSGLRASHQDEALLVQNYSGNPLALQIVANTISDFFGGNISAFRSEHGFVFDGIRAVLDQQFARLSELEREILIWLAIEREAVTVQVLRENFVKSVTTSALVDALHALQARGMLEKVSDGLTLQNVLIEYMTEQLIEGVCAEIADAANAGLWLNRFALLKAQAKEYVRQSQARLILQPVAERLLARLGADKLSASLQAHLAKTENASGFAAGNLLNLLLHLKIDVTGYDFSNRAVWQAFLREGTLRSLNFSQADLRGSVFTQPFGRIFSVAYSPNSSLIAGGSQDGTVFLWRADNGQSVGAFSGHTATVYSVAFSPDGTLLASASEDTTIRVWDWQAGQLRYVLRDHTSFVNSVAFSPDGRWLVSGSDDSRVRVWDVVTGQLIHNWLGNDPRVVQVAFGGPLGAEGLWLACGGDDGKIHVRETATGHVAQELDSPGRVMSLAFSKHPENSQAMLACTGTEGVVRLWDVNEQGHWLARDMPKGEEDINMTLAFSPDGALIASAGSGEFVHLRNARTGATVAKLSGHRYVDMIAFSPDGQSLVSTGADRSVRVWNVRNMQMQHMLNGYGAWVSALVFDGKNAKKEAKKDDKSDLWVSTIDDAQIRIWHAQTGNTRHTLRGHNKPVVTVAFSPSGRLLLSGEITGRVQIWDVPSGVLRDSLIGHKGQIQALASNQTDSVFAVAAYGEAVGLWRADGTAPAQQIGALEHHDKAIYALAFGGPAGTEVSLLAGSGDLNTYVWDVATGQVRFVLTGHHTYCQSLAFSPNGELLATGGWDHQVCIWDMDTGQLRHSLRGHHGSIMALAFSPDGRLLVSGSGDQQVCVWDVEHGTLIRTLQGHTAWLSAIAFNRDGTLLATGSANGAVKLWDVNRVLDSNPCLDTLYAKGPYAGMNISGVSGISDAQKYALKALGAVED